MTTCEDSAPALPIPPRHDATPGTAPALAASRHPAVPITYGGGLILRGSGAGSGVGTRQVRDPKHPFPVPRKNTWCRRRSPQTPNFGVATGFGRALPDLGGRPLGTTGTRGRSDPARRRTAAPRVTQTAASDGEPAFSPHLHPTRHVLPSVTGKQGGPTSPDPASSSRRGMTAAGGRVASA